MSALPTAYCRKGFLESLPRRGKDITHTLPPNCSTLDAVLSSSKHTLIRIPWVSCGLLRTEPYRMR